MFLFYVHPRPLAWCLFLPVRGRGLCLLLGLREVQEGLVEFEVTAGEFDIGPAELREGMDREVALGEEPQRRVPLRVEVMVEEAEDIETRLRQQLVKLLPDRLRVRFLNPLGKVPNLRLHIQSC